MFSAAPARADDYYAGGMAARHRSAAGDGCTTCGVPKWLAERAGFEPAEVLPSHDFQSCALGRTMLPLPDRRAPLYHRSFPLPNSPPTVGQLQRRSSEAQASDDHHYGTTKD